jgi:5'-deoxynucleotidase YfbR-like HD superfamily hydrolase
MNPFEIRAQLVEQAADFLKRQHEINNEFAKKTFDQLVTQGQKVQADYKEYMPVMYTFEDVLKEAEKLYGFVKNAK